MRRIPPEGKLAILILALYAIPELAKKSKPLVKWTGDLLVNWGESLREGAKADEAGSQEPADPSVVNADFEDTTIPAPQTTEPSEPAEPAEPARVEDAPFDDFTIPPPAEPSDPPSPEQAPVQAPVQAQEPSSRHVETDGEEPGKGPHDA